VKNGDIWIKVCPKCHSKEVTSRGAISEDALSPNFVCQSCGFQSAVFPEIKLEDAEKLPDQPRIFVPSRMPVVGDYAKMPIISKHIAKPVGYLLVLLLAVYVILLAVVSSFGIVIPILIFFGLLVIVNMVYGTDGKKGQKKD